MHNTWARILYTEEDDALWEADAYLRRIWSMYFNQHDIHLNEQLISYHKNVRSISTTAAGAAVHTRRDGQFAPTKHTHTCDTNRPSDVPDSEICSSEISSGLHRLGSVCPNP